MLLVFIFMVLVLGYCNYQQYFIYCLMAMTSQFIFLFFMEKKQLWKMIIAVFLTEGIIVSISQMIYYELNNAYTSLLKGVPFVIKEDFILHVISTILLFIIVLTIAYLIYKSVGEKMNLKKWVVLIGSYLINIVIMLIIISHVNMPFELLP